MGSHSLVTVRSSYYLSLSPNSDRSLLVLSVAILWLPFQIGSQVSHSREAREAPLFGLKIKKPWLELQQEISFGGHSSLHLYL